MSDKRISLQKLARLVPDLTVQKLARLPLNRLPEQIPADWCDQFPAEKRTVLLELSRRLADPASRERAEAHLKDQLGAAIRWVLKPETMATWLDTIGQNVDQAETLLQRWREGTGSLRQSGTWSSPASLQSEIELTSGGEVRVSDVEHVCGTLLLSFNNHEATVRKYAKLLKSFEKAIQREIGVVHLDTAVAEAEAQLRRLTEYMSRFRVVRLHLVSEEMTEQKRQIESMSRRRLELDSNMETVRQELRMAESWSGRLKTGRKKSDPEQLRQALSALEAQRGELTIPITDDQIYNWLNQLVDAILDDYCQSMAKSQIDRARALFVSLLKYRRRYTATPDLTAAGALAQSRRDDATRELQKLLVEIFQKRAPDPVASVKDPDHFRTSIEQLKNQIIQELLAPTTPRYAISG